MREVARRLGRAASTISRELRRNAATRRGGLEYRATTAQWHAERSARRPRTGKLPSRPQVSIDTQAQTTCAVPGTIIPKRSRGIDFSEAPPYPPRGFRTPWDDWAVSGRFAGEPESPGARW